MIRPVYINGYACLSPQETFETEEFLTVLHKNPGSLLTAIEPDYKAFVNPVAIRRMSRIVKMGSAVAKSALKQAGIEKPDAIIMGTGLGCMEDTEKFLKILIDDNEQTSAPTPFISSTHNSVAAQIALQLKCLGYNFTFVHKGFSLHSALLDTQIQIAMGEARNVLTGGIDEYTENKHRHYGLAGWWKQDLASTDQLFETKGTGTVAGEGAATFIIGAEPAPHCHIELSGTRSFYRPEEHEHTGAEIKQFLAEHGLELKDIDVCISGLSGDERDDHYYEYVHELLPADTNICVFKHLSGTWYTCDAFALWMACRIADTGSIPALSLYRPGRNVRPRNILIYNHNQQVSHVLHLIKWF
ncbi:MAG: 3-oxoacyl-ACP synthase [Bacteroidia bacterium]|nr:3-oxoacyl-ACP synthase [Bacteroidia bacterium]